MPWATGGSEIAAEPEVVTSGTAAVWRPFRAFGALACLIVIAGVPALISGRTEAGAVTLFVAAVLVLAGVRALVWRLPPARVSLVCDDQHLDVRRGAQLVQRDR